MRIAKMMVGTEVEGPGKRFAIWTQGCSIRCKGCINVAIQDPNGGEEISTEEIVTAVKDSGLTRITILGGEPLDQPHAIQALIYRLKLWVPGVSIMLFTGFEKDKAKKKLGLVWPEIDVIITGPYDASKPDTRKWIGSTNQQIHFKNPKHRDWKWPVKEVFEFEFSYDEKGAYQNGL